VSENGGTGIAFRRYDHQKDSQACLELLKEIGWVQQDTNRKMEAAVLAFLKSHRSWMAELRDRAESLAMTAAGEFGYLEESLSLCVVTTVATSTIARKLNCASRTTAEAIADAAEQGAQLAGLGVFEQGFYERLGFGAGSYEHWFDFDPSALKVGTPKRPPDRLSAEEWKKAYASYVNRMRGHGSCNLFLPEWMRMEMAVHPKSFGLGYYDGTELTHYLWLSNQGGEHGPLMVRWLAFRNWREFLELMSLIKSIGDQFYLVRMREPPGIQLQELIDRPFKYQRMTRQARYESRALAAAYWQMRILDLEACMEKTHLQGEPVQFNLELSDPIGKPLSHRAGWRGVAGSYTVRLGERSEARMGSEDRLPTLRAEVGAFTRMWMGAQRASGLASTDALSGPEELIHSLDRVLHVPQPHPDWDF
jgi:hypothetical protein